MACLRAAWPWFLLLAGACRGAPAPLPDGWWRSLGGEPALSAPFLQRVGADRRAIHGDLGHPEWRPGDELWFGLELFDGVGDAEPTRWLVSLIVLAPPAGADGGLYGREGTLTASTTQTSVDGRVEHHRGELSTCQQRVRAVVTDLGGDVLYDAESSAWDALQRIGLHDFLVLDEATRRERSELLGGSGTATDPIRHGIRDPWWLGTIFLRLFTTFQGNAALADVLWQVADMPGLADSVGFLFAPSYRVDYDQLQGVGRVAVPGLLEDHVASAATMPFRVSVGSSTVLLASLVVVPPHGVLSLTAGIVGMTGHRPSAPHRRFVLCLLGARRGDAEAGRPR